MTKDPISDLTPSTFFIIAGEQSADNHGAQLMNAILAQNSNIIFCGIGGKKMIDVGLKSIEEIQKMAVMGFVEIIRHLGFFHNLTNRVLDEIANCQPKQIILIDYPGFNLRLTKKIKERFDIPITYYISPQIWAWKEKRIEIIRKYVDQMLVIFPFEENWYKKRGLHVKFVGHPIFDEWQPTSKKELCKQLNIKPEKPIITLYPGSRNQEVNRHLPILLKTADKLRRNDLSIQFMLGVAQNINIEKLGIPSWIQIEYNHPQKVLECADLALITSGTSTLEAAVFGIPMIIIYKMNPISWLVSRALVNVPFAGMVNIIAGSMIMPELLQNKATSEQIYNLAEEIINNPEKITHMKLKLSKVRDLLKGEGASNRAAKYILDLNINT